MIVPVTINLTVGTERGWLKGGCLCISCRAAKREDGNSEGEFHFEVSRREFEWMLPCDLGSRSNNNNTLWGLL